MEQKVYCSVTTIKNSNLVKIVIIGSVYRIGVLETEDFFLGMHIFHLYASAFVKI